MTIKLYCGVCGKEIEDGYDTICDGCGEVICYECLGFQCDKCYSEFCKWCSTNECLVCEEEDYEE